MNAASLVQMSVVALGASALTLFGREQFLEPHRNSTVAPLEVEASAPKANRMCHSS